MNLLIPVVVKIAQTNRLVCITATSMKLMVAIYYFQEILNLFESAFHVGKKIAAAGPVNFQSASVCVVFIFISNYGDWQ